MLFGGESSAPAFQTDRTVSWTRPEVSLSAYSFLFSEMFSYCRKGAESVAELHARLNQMGSKVGASMHELVCHREQCKRETVILKMLQYLQTTFWRAVFGKPADALERGSGTEGQYLLWENTPLISKFITVPRDFPNLSVCAFSAGIIRGALEAAHMPAEVSALNGVEAGGAEGTTVYVIEFAPSVLAREKKAGKSQ